MKFDINKNILFTDKGVPIKKLHCPYDSSWDDMQEQSHSKNRFCALCEREILDTQNMSEKQLILAVKKDDNTCLKVDFHQTNIEMVAVYER